MSTSERVLQVLKQHRGYPLRRGYVCRLAGVKPGTCDMALSQLETEHLIAEDEVSGTVYLTYMGRTSKRVRNREWRIRETV